MLGPEEILFDEYKRVDNICRDMFLSQSGVSQYIAEMEENSSYGRATVPMWDRDYRRLKRVRWLRNQIAHDSLVTDCGEEDVAWLKEFHDRLLNLQDPLALLEEANRAQTNSSPRHKSRPTPAPVQRADRNAQLQEKQEKEASSTKERSKALILLAAMLVGLAVTAVFLIFR